MDAEYESLNDDNNGNEEDDETEWFNQYWNSNIQVWKNHATSFVSSNLCNDTILSPFLIPEKLSSMCQFSRVVSFSCMHETRKWLEVTNTPDTNDQRNNMEEDKVDVYFCNRYLGVLIDISIIFLVFLRHSNRLVENTTKKTISATMPTSSIRKEDHQNLIKLQQLGPSEAETLDTAGIVLHCARHLIRRSVRSFFLENLSTNTVKNDRTYSNASSSTKKHLEKLHKIVSKTKLLDQYANEFDCLSNKQSLGIVAEKIFSALASVDASFENIMKIVDEVSGVVFLFFFKIVCVLVFF